MVFGYKYGLRSDLRAPNLKHFSGGPCPQTPLAYACLRTHHHQSPPPPPPPQSQVPSAAPVKSLQWIILDMCNVYSSSATSWYEMCSHMMISTIATGSSVNIYCHCLILCCCPGQKDVIVVGDFNMSPENECKSQRLTHMNSSMVLRSVC